MRVQFISLLLVFSQTVFAKNVALFWGAGGELFQRESTIFDSDFRAFVPGLMARGWQVRPLFGWGHSKTEYLVNQELGPNDNREFNSQNVSQEIEKLLLEIKSLSRVLLIVSSHGLPPEKEIKTHQVMASDSLRKKTVDLNLIQELQKALEFHQIPFAILDLGCYSGATLDLASKNTCVISASSSQEFSYSHFAQALAREFFKGHDFETSFLSARLKFDDFSSPEISTPENSIIKFQLALQGLNQFPHKKYLYCSSCEIHSRLLKLYDIDIERWDFLNEDSQLKKFITQLLDIRKVTQEKQEQYKKNSITFDEMENFKSKSLIQHFFIERQLYRHWYEKIQSR
ncbi:MAG: hypothetical protein ACK5V3_16965, partial [Bdellovibrionales bacterium]